MGRMGQMSNSEGFMGGLAFHFFIYTVEIRFDIYIIVRRFVNIVLFTRHNYATLHPLRPSCILFIH